jgi:hypothetical protein
MLKALSALSPARIVGIADAADVLTRTEQMKAVHSIVIAYLEELMFDAVDHLEAARPVNQREVENIIWDAVNEDPLYDPVAWLCRAGCPLELRAAA